MKILRIVCHALALGLAAALAACGSPAQFGASSASSHNVSYPLGAPLRNVRSAAAPPRHHRSKTFRYSGAQQNFMVPTGVNQITVQAYGAGAGGPYGGGYVKATIPVTPGESLAIFVGGNPSYTTGGFNGGGNGGSGIAVGGAGASDVRQGGSALANRVIVAGGQGGRGGNGVQPGGAGGAGGGLVAGSGGIGGGERSGVGGSGGSQSKGGAGGKGCSFFNGTGGPGTLGIGGPGGFSKYCSSGPGGGGGGGGYYGGGGGGSGLGQYQGHLTSGGGGGGGGSSYVEPSAQNVTNQQGGSTVGLIVISW